MRATIYSDSKVKRALNYLVVVRRHIRWFIKDIRNFRNRKRDVLRSKIMHWLYVDEARHTAVNAGSDVQEIQMILEKLMVDYLERNPQPHIISISGRRWDVASSDDYRLDRNPPEEYYRLKGYFK